MRIYIHLIDKDPVEKQLYNLKVLYTIKKYTYGYCIELHNDKDWKEIEPIFKKMRLVYSLREMKIMKKSELRKIIREIIQEKWSYLPSYVSTYKQNPYKLGDKVIVTDKGKSVYNKEGVIIDIYGKDKVVVQFHNGNMMLSTNQIKHK